MSRLEYHILLALAGSPLYGYAIADAVSAESSGTLAPRAGSLYRVFARLVSEGLVKEVAPAGGVPVHPGLARKYYALSAAGRRELQAETQRLKHATAIAERRLGGQRA